MCDLDLFIHDEKTYKLHRKSKYVLVINSRIIFSYDVSYRRL